MQDLSGTNETSLKDWSLITGRGAGLQNWKIMGPKCFALPPPLQQWRIQVLKKEGAHLHNIFK